MNFSKYVVIMPSSDTSNYRVVMGMKIVMKDEPKRNPRPLDTVNGEFVHGKHFGLTKE